MYENIEPITQILKYWSFSVDSMRVRRDKSRYDCAWFEGYDKWYHSSQGENVWELGKCLRIPMLVTEKEKIQPLKYKSTSSSFYKKKKTTTKDKKIMLLTLIDESWIIHQRISSPRQIGEYI